MIENAEDFAFAIFIIVAGPIGLITLLIIHLDNGLRHLRKIGSKWDTSKIYRLGKWIVGDKDCE